ncbi:trehalose-phosphatase, partial [Mycobacterium gordonae]
MQGRATFIAFAAANRGSHCGIVTMVTDWPATIDRRYHDAVILNLDGVLSAAASGGFRASESTGPLLRRLREAGIGTAVYSGTREGAQLSGGLIDELADVDAVEFADEHDSSVLIRTAGRLKVRPDRCAVIEHDPAGVEDACAAGFSLVIALDHGSEELTSHGADAVIADLAEISVRNVDSAISAITDALQVYSQLKELVTARQPVVFVDFDGTMADIVGQPETAALVPGAADALRALTPHCPVAVISGRDLADLRARIDVDGLWFAGSHGFELVAPDGTLHQNADAAASVGVLVRAAVRLADELKDIPGTIVERKRYAVAVHYRNTDPQAVDRVIAAVRRLGRSAGLRVTTGRKLVELRPNVSWDKGKALHWILEHLATEQNSSSTTTLPIFIGDDISDEDGFDAIRFDGVGIAVRHLEGGDRPSAATFSLESPSAVTQFLQRLADDLRDEAAAPSDAWELVYDHYDPATERLRETLCTVGNGYVATRGCAAEATASQHHYPGTYGTGVYNILADQIAGRTIENESLVNLPNWLSLTFRIDGGPWFHIDQAEILSYRQTFDLRHATLSRRVRFTDAAGRITTLDQQRFASMHDPHLLAMKTVVEAENWSGTIEFESVLDATVRNTMVERYNPLSSAHLSESAIDDGSLECGRRHHRGGTAGGGGRRFGVRDRGAGR